MNEVMTIAEVAKKLRIGRNAAYKAVQTGELPVIKIGRRLLVPISALENKLTESYDLSHKIAIQELKQLKKQTERKLRNHIKLLEKNLNNARIMLKNMMMDE